MLETITVSRELFNAVLRKAAKNTAHQLYLEKHGIEGKGTGLGYSETEKKWYGWSHRAIYGFGIGDVVKEGDCITFAARTHRLPVGFKAKTLADAEKMARAFAESVS